MEPSTFTPTIWSLIQQAAEGKQEAITRIHLQYRRPVFLFVRSRISRDERDVDADVITDQVMTRVLDPGFLKEAAPSKGRFRDLLLAVTRHALYNAVRKANAEIRGGGRPRVSLQDVLAMPPAPEDERRDFEQFYASAVLNTARANLEREGEGRLYAEVLALHYDRGWTQAEVARYLGRSAMAVNSLLHRAREALKDHLAAVLGLVASTEQEVEEEGRLLLSIFGRRGRVRR